MYNTTQSGKLYIDNTAATKRITRLGTIHTAVEQLMDNCMDAVSTSPEFPKIVEVYFDTQSDTLYIIDEGNGLVGPVPDEDLQVLLSFANNREKIPGVDDPPTKVHNVTSCFSLVYMMLSAGYSIKNSMSAFERLLEIINRDNINWKTSTASNPQGVYGIGILESIGNAKKVTITSRPVRQLAEVHYGVDYVQDNGVPTYALYPPTNEDINQRNSRYSIEKVDEGLIHPRTGEQLEHGTIVKLEGVTTTSLNPERLANKLSSRFGISIAKNHIQIYIYVRKPGIQRVSGKKYSVSTDTLHIVAPIRFSGTPILDELLTIENLVAHVQIYASDKKGTAPLSFTRRQVVGGPVSELDMFNQYPFNHPQVTGIVEIDAPVGEDERIWDTAKRLPNINNTDVRMLLQQITNLGDQISEKLQALENKAQDTKLAAIQRCTYDSLMTVLADNEIFSSMSFIPKSKQIESVKGKRDRGKRSEVQGLSISVIDEYNHALRGDQGVMFEIVKTSPKDSPPDHRPLYGGNIHIQSIQQGTYKIRILLPDTIRLADGQKDSTLCQINKQSGARVLFKVHTGQPPRKPADINNLRPPAFASLGEYHDYYSLDQYAGTGVIVINIDKPNFVEAYQSDDYASLAYAIASPTAAALMELAFAEDGDIEIDHFVLNKQLELTYDFARELRKDLSQMKSKKRPLARV